MSDPVKIKSKQEVNSNISVEKLAEIKFNNIMKAKRIIAQFIYEEYHERLSSLQLLRLQYYIMSSPAVNNDYIPDMCDDKCSNYEPVYDIMKPMVREIWDNGISEMITDDVVESIKKLDKYDVSKLSKFLEYKGKKSDSFDFICPNPFAKCVIAPYDIHPKYLDSIGLKKLVSGGLVTVTCVYDRYSINVKCINDGKSKTSDSRMGYCLGHTEDGKCKLASIVRHTPIFFMDYLCSKNDCWEGYYNILKQLYSEYNK